MNVTEDPRPDGLGEAADVQETPTAPEQGRPQPARTEPGRHEQDRHEQGRHEQGRHEQGGPVEPETETETEPEHEHGLDEDDDEYVETYSQHPRPGAAIISAVREAAIVVGMALVLSLVVKTWLMQAFYIPSGSMENTLVSGDRVIVSKLTPGPFALERGDVVVFEDPANWLGEPQHVERGPIGAAIHDSLTFVGLLPTDEGNHLIKRVIGLPGDHVVCCDDQHRVTVNGQPLNEPYLKPGDAPSRQEFDITVPAGRVWVMGDHRSDSSDSRFHDNGDGGKTGSVPESKIVGRAVSVVWPVADWAWLSRPDETFAKVPPPQTSAAGH